MLYKPAVVFDLLLLQEVDTLPDYLMCLFIFDCFKVSIFAASFFTKNLAMFTHEVKNLFASFCWRIMLSSTVVYLSRFLCVCISLLDVLVTLATGYVTSSIIAAFKNIFWSGVWHLQTAECRPQIADCKWKDTKNLPNKGDTIKNITTFESERVAWEPRLIFLCKVTLASFPRCCWLFLLLTHPAYH